MKEASTGQVKEYQRLKTIYKISKLLSIFESIEITLPKIFNATSEVFPLLSAAIVENWDQKTQTAIWHSANVDSEHVSKALVNAKISYIYLSGVTELDSKEFCNNEKNDSITELSINRNTKSSDYKIVGDYIVLPLIIDNLPPRGVLQLEGAAQLQEDDLEFVAALADLISVALDRYYKIKNDREIQEKETKANLEILNISKDKVETLELQKILREEFVSLLTHDLRSPLTVIYGSAQLILLREEDSEIAKNSANRIVKQVDRVNRMITNLLDANRINSGQKLPMSRVSVDLTKLIEDTITDLTTVHGDRFIFNHGTKIEASLDLNGVQRIIENLGNNAIKYGFSDTPVVITLDQNENQIIISVQNNGHGITLEDQKTLFNQYRRTLDVDNSSIKGWGIGLTLVKGVAEAHGGYVKVDSELEGSTVFTVVLPL